jgi:hypothetical protein
MLNLEPYMPVIGPGRLFAPRAPGIGGLGTGGLRGSREV